VSDKGVVIAASKWGKIKTVSQMVMVIYLLMGLPGAMFDSIGMVLIFVSLVFTIVSAVDYVVKNFHVLET